MTLKTKGLGHCYRIAKGVTKNRGRGFALSLEAAQGDVAAAQYDAASVSSPERV
jgi:hypothetical protein